MAKHNRSRGSRKARIWGKNVGNPTDKGQGSSGGSSSGKKKEGKKGKGKGGRGQDGD